MSIFQKAIFYDITYIYTLDGLQLHTYPKVLPPQGVIDRPNETPFDPHSMWRHILPQPLQGTYPITLLRVIEHLVRHLPLPSLVDPPNPLWGDEAA